MTYDFHYRAHSHHPGDAFERARPRVVSDILVETFEAESDDKALLTAIGVLKNKTFHCEGKEYRPEAISLHRVVDISFLR